MTLALLRLSFFHWFVCCVRGAHLHIHNPWFFSVSLYVIVERIFRCIMGVVEDLGWLGIIVGDITWVTL